MNYIIHKPTGILKKYIKFICTLEVKDVPSGLTCMNLPPSGFVEIAIIPQKLTVKGKNNKDNLTSRGVISGQKTTFSRFIPGDMDVISLCLYPETAYSIIGIPVDELTDYYITPEDIWKTEGKNLTERITETSDKKKRVKILEDFILGKILKTSCEPNKRLVKAVEILGINRGQVRIDKLAERVCLSKRQLERLFRQKIGLSPKEFSRIIRFQAVLFAKQKDKTLSFTDLAYSSGYFDQAHFINDFKQISGYKPGEYFSFDEIVSDYYSF